MFDHSLVTTAPQLEGYRIVRHLGVVRGITVRSRSFIGNVGALFQILAGGNITLYQQLCERARSEAYETMITHAQQLGANAVVAFRYDTTDIAGGVSEVLAYGSAVVVERAV
ncbi:MAG TPA: heavy metal-binding domain-containing protein [Bacteroidota bacterium]|nr:heavy metal-binding domain-containing protein [Bacteroidota bacterium]